MLAAMDPVLDEETWVFCAFAECIRRDVTPMALALFREEEGLSAILSLADARSLSLGGEPVTRQRVPLTRVLFLGPPRRLPVSSDDNDESDDEDSEEGYPDEGEQGFHRGEGEGFSPRAVP